MMDLFYTRGTVRVATIRHTDSRGKVCNRYFLRQSNAEPSSKAGECKNTTIIFPQKNKNLPPHNRTHPSQPPSSPIAPPFPSRPQQIQPQPGHIILLTMTCCYPQQPSIADPSSPLRRQALSESKNNISQTRADQYFNATNSLNPVQMSLTEQQILSHPLIKQIVDRSKGKTVQHDVNRIANDAKLYRQPMDHSGREFDFGVIPPAQQDYVSTASQKVKEIHHRLSDDKDLYQRLTEIAQRNMDKCQQGKKMRPASAQAVSNNRRVSVSGLVSYNFNSIRARRSLGGVPDQPEEAQLAKKAEQTRRRNSASVDRADRIIKRKPNPYSAQKVEIGRAAVCDFHTPTDKFLKVLMKQSHKDVKVYGQRMQKLNCIKQYMEKQKTDYEHAEFIVETILNSRQKQSIKTVVNKKNQYKIDDEVELNKRRRAIAHKRVLLKHLYFTE